MPPPRAAVDGAGGGDRPLPPAGGRSGPSIHPDQAPTARARSACPPHQKRLGCSAVPSGTAKRSDRSAGISGDRPSLLQAARNRDR